MRSDSEYAFNRLFVILTTIRMKVAETVFHNGLLLS